MALHEINRALTCVKCQKVYSHKRSLTRHAKQCQGPEQTRDPKPIADKLPFECESCQKQFAH